MASSSKPIESSNSVEVDRSPRNDDNWDNKSSKVMLAITVTSIVLGMIGGGLITHFFMPHQPLGWGIAFGGIAGAFVASCILAKYTWGSKSAQKLISIALPLFAAMMAGIFVGLYTGATVYGVVTFMGAGLGLYVGANLILIKRNYGKIL